MLPVVLFAFMAGVLTIVAPCTLPALPALLGGGIGPGRYRLLGLCAGFFLDEVAASRPRPLATIRGPDCSRRAAALAVSGDRLAVELRQAPP